MTAIASAARWAAPTTVLLAGFTGAVLVRVAVAGPAGAGSVPAGLAFAVLLIALAASARVDVRTTPRAVATGLVGAAVLVLPVLLGSAPTTGRSLDGYAGWAAATVLVAGAEEAFLRGALFDAVQRAPITRGHSTDAAVVVAAVAFAALHLPFYGWGAMPLDLAVGLALGALRVVTGTWTAPAVAHITADLVGWWFV